MRYLLFALVIMQPFLPAADRQERIIEGAGQAWKVSFDASRMMWPAAYEIAKLSPEMNGAFYSASNVNACIVELKEYAPCGTRDYRDPNFFRNSEVNIRKADGEISGLAQQKLSGPLATVRDFILKRQKMWRWINATTVEYLKERDISSLKSGWPDDPGPGDCQSIVNRVRQASTDAESYHLVFYEWATCQNHRHRELLEPGSAYPKEAWQKGAAEAGITVEEQFRSID